MNPDLLNRLRKTLINCGPFHSGDELRHIFIDERIKPWANSIPNATSTEARVNATIDWLSGQALYDTGESGLVLLLKVLSEYKNSQDRCHHDLAEIAHELKTTYEKDKNLGQVLLTQTNQVNLHEVNLVKRNLAGWNLVGMDLAKKNFTKADLTGANLFAANLRKAKLTQATLDKADLTVADLRKANLRKASLVEAILEDADLSGTDFTEADLTLAKLRGAILDETQIDDKWVIVWRLVTPRISWEGVSDIMQGYPNADLRGADVSEVDFAWSILKGVLIDDTTKIKDKWRLVWELVTHGGQKRDLSGVDLSKAILSEADLSNSNLSGANLSEAQLRRSHLCDANLSDVDLSQTDLNQADLRRANLSGANLSRADLSNVYFHGANLSKVDLSGAIFNGARCDQATEWPQGFDPSQHNIKIQK